MPAKVDKEIESYRCLMEAPGSYEEGFGWKTIIGVLFIGLIITPGSIYLGLVTGQTLGPAAEWVTVILFAEVARRSLKPMTRQELYILFYVAAAVVSAESATFGGLIWNQYLVQSPAAKGFGIAKEIPKWVSPQPDSLGIIDRTFFHPDWLPAIGVLLASVVLSRISWFTIGYTLFRVTSDIERLPFPMAPVYAQGATALAESGTKKETWRWRVFSIGAKIGLWFGVLYAGVPIITSLIFTRPLMILPIPFVDLTQNIENNLPAATFGFTMNLGTLLVGFVLPFWSVVGGFVAAVGMIILNPILYKAGILTTWRRGMGTIDTIFVNSMDFWLSFGIGTGFAVALIGLIKMVQSFRMKRQSELESRVKPPPTRGDFPIPVAIALFILATLGYIFLCKKLVPKFPTPFFVFFGFVLTPLISYINARMVGLTSQTIGFPMIREASFILSGYRGAAIWFAPIPYANYGWTVQKFREIELTGTRFSSIIKAELFMVPVVVVCSLFFWWLIWQLGAIPSADYPYANKMWHLDALQQCRWPTATLGKGEQWMLKAIKYDVISIGFGFGLFFYVLLSLLGLPVLLIYGFIRGVGVAMPHFLIAEFIGALIGRYYFARKLGTDRWRRYAPVLFAGFSCGMGLVGMGGAAIALLSKCISHLPF